MTTDTEPQTVLGSPPRAGMDQAQPALPCRCSRFPPARGDGPGPGTRCPPERRVPPRARGWTPQALLDGLLGAGSPPRAGMDREPASARTGCPGFPPARGDGPSCPLSCRPRMRVPPRARGWTLRRPTHRPAASGSPPRAGMDPYRMASSFRHEGFPPARGDGGDGPRARRASGSESRVPPRARGWTRFRRAGGDRWAGSPPRAGMDPSPIPSRRRSLGFPPARGDGP